MESGDESFEANLHVENLDELGPQIDESALNDFTETVVDLESSLESTLEEQTVNEEPVLVNDSVFLEGLDENRNNDCGNSVNETFVDYWRSFLDRFDTVSDVTEAQINRERYKKIIFVKF